jgi:hypothetical protein
MHVQLRVAVAASLLRESCNRDFLGSSNLPSRLRRSSDHDGRLSAALPRIIWNEGAEHQTAA